MKRNKANYSLDADDGIEYAACEFEPSPEMALDLMEQYRRLCCALNQLPLFRDSGLTHTTCWAGRFGRSLWPRM